MAGQTAHRRPQRRAGAQRQARQRHIRHQTDRCAHGRAGAQLLAGVFQGVGAEQVGLPAAFGPRRDIDFGVVRVKAIHRQQRLHARRHLPCQVFFEAAQQRGFAPRVHHIGRRQVAAHGGGADQQAGDQLARGAAAL